MFKCYWRQTIHARLLWLYCLRKNMLLIFLKYVKTMKGLFELVLWELDLKDDKHIIALWKVSYQITTIKEATLNFNVG